MWSRPITMNIGPLRAVDRAEIVLARTFTHEYDMRSMIGERRERELRSQMRLALNTEVRAGGPFPDNEYNAIAAACAGMTRDQLVAHVVRLQRRIGMLMDGRDILEGGDECFG